ncbi:MAG TPA: adenosylmethionine--8-amino-7-oxononanoate transaminase [Candidatus Methylacidiphilales bacterium]|nr:adenosylmethionine--8-amino-7-oxononanoate transaminase [Candidatus Methylacidiphilales bacterium]
MTPADLDRRYIWHPFTQMRDWNAPGHQPLVIVEGRGALLRTDDGRDYLDGNSSIWTNLHGHRRSEIDQAIRDQLGRIAHSSFLGLTNDVAVRLARELTEVTQLHEHKVFFSDDGSTAIEAALKMVHQARIQRGEKTRKAFVSLTSGYHGDTVGAMSAGHSAVFHAAYKTLLFESREVMSPACYRCPHNRAKPVRGSDARATRQCDWECAGELVSALDTLGEQASALVLEPRIQGAAGMTMHPRGYLEKAAAACCERGVWLVLDEVMTGFGRTGPMFAFQDEKITPDLVALAKGLTGGYLPVAATLASPEIFDAFLGGYAETFFHGHSYTGNALGCAAALANLGIFETDQTLQKNAVLAEKLTRLLAKFWDHPHVGDVRQEGLICGIEIVADFVSRRPFPIEERTGHRICHAARKHGLLTRPVGDVLVLMPPYCVTDDQLAQMTDALWRGLCEVLPP